MNSQWKSLMKKRIIMASSPTESGLKKLISEYCYDTPINPEKYTITLAGDVIQRRSNGENRTLDGKCVSVRRGRWYFEEVAQ